MARIARALAPGGYLFLGMPRPCAGCRRRSTCATPTRPSTTSARYRRQRRRRRRQTLGPADRGRRGRRCARAATAWIEAIGRASERIRALVATRSRTRPRTSRRRPAATGPRDQALELLREERFAEALALVRRLARRAARDPDVLLLHAVLLTHSGRAGAAEDSLPRAAGHRRAERRRPLPAGALPRGRGRSPRRRRARPDAVYLDPAFAMPRLHLGLLAAARRRPARPRAASSARRCSLLQREDASRLLLFGGGFTRDALLALCRAELSACGRRSR